MSERSWRGRRDLSEAKRGLVGLMAEEKQRHRDEESLAARIAELTDCTEAALKGGHDELARDIAARIAVLESQLEMTHRENTLFSEDVLRLRRLITRTEARANHPVQRAMRHLDLLEAELELELGDDLYRRMADAGIGPLSDYRSRAKEILDEIRSR